MPESWRPAATQLVKWAWELFLLLSAFDAVREEMGDELAAERADMLDHIDGLDQAERERIRPVVIDSAMSIFDSYAFEMAIRRVMMANPLPAILLAIPGLLLAVPLLIIPITSLSHLHGTDGWIQFLGVVTASVWLLRKFGRLGTAGRALRTLMVAIGVFFWFASPHVAPWDGLRHFTKDWVPAVPAVSFQFTIPYPAWLGMSYVAVPAALVTFVALVIEFARRSTLGKRRRVLGGTLLHALLDVAYRAQMIASNPELTSSPLARVSLYRLIRLAARVAAREWVAALRTGNSHIDRITRDQGRAMSAAINRWDRRAALAGSELPKLSKAFTVAVVNAADSDWAALAGDSATEMKPRRRAWRLLSQALSLAVPLGAAAGIVFGIRPVPQTLSALLTFLVGLSIARVLRWLDLSVDIDPGLTVSELLRKPK